MKFFNNQTLALFAGSFYLQGRQCGIGVIPGQNLLIVRTLLRHELGARLAHPYAMAISQDCKGKDSIRIGNGEVGRTQSKGASYVVAVHLLPTDGYIFYRTGICPVVCTNPGGRVAGKVCVGCLSRTAFWNSSALNDAVV